MPVLIASQASDPDAAWAWNRDVGVHVPHILAGRRLAATGEPAGQASTCTLYAAAGFGRSVQGVWNQESIALYAAAVAAGNALHDAAGQDVHQLGGDLVLRRPSDGTSKLQVRLAYYSTANTDRLAPALLIHAASS